MNRFSINAASINADKAVAGQRAIVSSLAYAKVAATGRVLRRSPTQAQPRGAITLVPRARINGQVSVQAQAVLTQTGLNRVRTKVRINARAEAFLVGDIASRGYVSHPVGIGATAIIWASGKVHVRGPVLVGAQGRITLASPKSYARQRGIVVGGGRAAIKISFDIRKQIPYDADAPEERTIFIPSVNRTMVV